MTHGVTHRDHSQESLGGGAVRKDGTGINVEYSIILLRDDAGELLGAAAIMRDVTTRRQRGREISERVV